MLHVEQSPGDIVFLSASDTEINTLSEAYQALYAADDTVPTSRLANLGYFKQELTVDTYVEEVLSRAKLIVMRVLGGKGYFYVSYRAGTAAEPDTAYTGDLYARA